ncbi:hypothetical protein BT69DRAFT_956677 [Atractiella rhizophila]|nr:hypothetical protein BT69DRAFT_956677 [Atractiella rhizophila]
MPLLSLCRKIKMAVQKKNKKNKKGSSTGNSTEDRTSQAADATAEDEVKADGEAEPTSPEVSTSIQDKVEETPENAEALQPEVENNPEVSTSVQDNVGETENAEALQPEVENPTTPITKDSATIIEESNDGEKTVGVQAAPELGEQEAEGGEENHFAEDNWNEGSKKKKKGKRGKDGANSTGATGSTTPAPTGGEQEEKPILEIMDAADGKVATMVATSKSKKKKKGKGGTESTTTTRPSSPTQENQELSPKTPDDKDDTKVSGAGVAESNAAGSEADESKVAGDCQGVTDVAAGPDATTLMTTDGNTVDPGDSTSLTEKGKKKKKKGRSQSVDNFDWKSPPTTPSTPKTGFTTPAAEDPSFFDQDATKGELNEQGAAAIDDNQAAAQGNPEEGIPVPTDNGIDANAVPRNEPSGDTVPLAALGEVNPVEGETTGQSADDQAAQSSVDAAAITPAPPGTEDTASTFVIPAVDDTSELDPPPGQEVATAPAPEEVLEPRLEAPSTQEAKTEPVQTVPPGDVSVEPVPERTDTIVDPILDPTTQDPKTTVEAQFTVDGAVALDPTLDAAAVNAITAVTKEPIIEGDERGGKGNKKKKDKKKKGEKEEKEEPEEVKVVASEKQVDNSGKLEGTPRDLEKQEESQNKKKGKKGKGKGQATEDLQPVAAEVPPSPVPVVTDISTSANTPVQLPATPASGEQPLFPSMGAPVVGADPISPTSSVLFASGKVKRDATDFRGRSQDINAHTDLTRNAMKEAETSYLAMEDEARRASEHSLGFPEARSAVTQLDQLHLEIETALNDLPTREKLIPRSLSPNTELRERELREENDELRQYVDDMVNLYESTAKKASDKFNWSHEAIRRLSEPILKFLEKEDARKVRRDAMLQNFKLKLGEMQAAFQELDNVRNRGLEVSVSLYELCRLSRV